MRTNLLSSTVVFCLAMIFFTSCKQTVSGTSPTPQSTPANTNAPALTPEPAVPSKPVGASTAKGPPRLEGSYVMTEVQDGGISTLMSEMRTVINFSPDGTYRRGSSKKDKIYHTDSGQYSVNGDQLLLTIQWSKKGMDSKIHNPALQKTHKFSVSADGDEL